MISLTGAVPCQEIKNLIKNGHVINGRLENIQPSSLDLSIGEKIYRLPSVFLPRHDEKVEDVALALGAEPYDFNLPLELNTSYLVKLNEELNLPSEVYAYSNPKSSTGRVDLHVAVLSDGIPRFDSAGNKGYHGSLWAFVKPRSFRIKISPGDALLQLRFFYSDTRFTEKDLGLFYDSYQPFFSSSEEFIARDKIKISDHDGGLIMTLDLRGELVGWRSEGSQKFLDFSKKSHYKPMDFFTPIYRDSKNFISVRKGDFYILYTSEKLRVPPDFAAEIMPVDVRNGEYRSHYAGFIDPGFGYGKNGEIKGRSIVLELRPFEDDIILRNNQPICKVIFEKMAARPEAVYGETGSNYASQSGPRLSKHFVGL